MFWPCPRRTPMAVVEEERIGSTFLTTPGIPAMNTTVDGFRAGSSARKKEAQMASSYVDPTAMRMRPCPIAGPYARCGPFRPDRCLPRCRDRKRRLLRTAESDGWQKVPFGWLPRRRMPESTGSDGLPGWCHPVKPVFRRIRNGWSSRLPPFCREVDSSFDYITSAWRCEGVAAEGALYGAKVASVPGSSLPARFSLASIGEQPFHIGGHIFASYNGHAAHPTEVVGRKIQNLESDIPLHLIYANKFRQGCVTLSIPCALASQ